MPRLVVGLLVSALALAVGVLCVPSSARAISATTYMKTSAITSGGKYLLVANITNNPISTAHSPAPTVLGSVDMNSLMAGTQAFSLNGSVLKASADLSSWEFTISSSGTSDGANPGYWIKSGSSYLSLTQDLTGVFDALTPPITVGTTLAT